jgi:PadR family transcriptional regulator, regulatory protein PadR
MPLSPDQLRGHLESLILAALAGGPAHGFEIRTRLEQGSANELSVREGTIYPAIYRLENRGLIEGEWEGAETQRRGPRRRVYRLTRKGHSELKSARKSWLNFSHTISALLMEPQS